MKILISIIFNSLILFALQYLLWANSEMWIEAGIIVTWGIIAYIFGWVLLWVLNATVKPILKILALPFFFLFFWLSSILINWVTLWLLQYLLNDLLKIDWISYTINWDFNFIVAVAIFSFLNIIYSLIINK